MKLKTREQGLQVPGPMVFGPDFAGTYCCTEIPVPIVFLAGHSQKQRPYYYQPLSVLPLVLNFC